MWKRKGVFNIEVLQHLEFSQMVVISGIIKSKA